MKVATRDNQTLEACYINLTNFYDQPTMLSHIGLFGQRNTHRYNKGRQFVTIKPVTGRNEMAIYVPSLKRVNWRPLHRLST